MSDPLQLLRSVEDAFNQYETEVDIGLGTYVGCDRERLARAGAETAAIARNARVIIREALHSGNVDVASSVARDTLTILQTRLAAVRVERALRSA
jgi:hypothetical protein